ncbi:MAG TPA: heavy metal-binding domain-containing protein [Ignavibacteriales bacterium]|nr:heavy metal-binding domain-containing protein [Ignavibacteriales bacterium]
MPFKRIFFFAAFLSLSLIIASGCGEKKTSRDEQNTPQEQQQRPPQKQVQANNNTSLRANTIVREGLIDLKAIDENKDGKVFECPMDYNVVSDYKGTCPKCGMDLEEVSIEKAKSNLTANGYKVR